MKFTGSWDNIEIEFEDTDTDKEREIVNSMFNLMKALVRREE